MLSFRPHHALCIQFFEGKVYSTEFIENMSGIIESLKNNPEIMITFRCDVLCRKCPNLVNGECSCSEKSERYDRKTAKLSGFSEGAVIRADEFFSSARTAVILGERLDEVCGDCCWNQICSGKSNLYMQK